jgi:copper chaperone CopZ
MRTIIELDCGEMPPGCGFQCGICVQEIQEAVAAVEGVTRFSQHADNRIEIEHDADKVSQESLLKIITKLPTGQKGHFTARVVGP